MGLVWQDVGTLAQSDGLTAITGLAFGSTIWLKNTGAFSVSNDLASWIRIPTRGANRLIVQFRGQIVDIAGITANATNNLTCMAVGEPFEEPDSTLKQRILASNPGVLAAVPAAEAGVLLALRPLNLSSDGTLAYQFGASGRKIGTMMTHTAAFLNKTLLYGTGAPVNGDLVSWGFEVGLHDDAASAGTAAANGYIGVNYFPMALQGMDAVWISMSLFMSGTTGTAANFRERFKMRALVGREVSSADRSNFSWRRGT